MFVIILLLKTR